MIILLIKVNKHITIMIHLVSLIKKYTIKICYCIKYYIISKDTHYKLLLKLNLNLNLNQCDY